MAIEEQRSISATDNKGKCREIEQLLHEEIY